MNRCFVLLLVALVSFASTTLFSSEAHAQFRYTSSAPTNPRFARYQAMMDSNTRLQTLLQRVNETFRLPREIPVLVEQCGRRSANYNLRLQRIQLCYEMIEWKHRQFSRRSPEAADAAAMGAIAFSFLHEASHALIHQFRLNVPGSPEDAADQLGALVSIWTHQSVVALQGGRSLRDLNGGRAIAGDVHSPGPERFENMYCMVYGSNPTGFAVIANSGLVSATRLNSCPSEFAAAQTRWNNWLRPFRG